MGGAEAEKPERPSSAFQQKAEVSHTVEGWRRVALIQDLDYSSDSSLTK